MTIEQIAIRQEIRQMLSEVGINKNTLKGMAVEVLQEEIKRAIFQAFNDTNTSDPISNKIEQCINESARKMVREEIRNRVCGIFGGMTIAVDITDQDGRSVITR